MLTHNVYAACKSLVLPMLMYSDRKPALNTLKTKIQSNISNSMSRLQVEWDTEKECFQTLAAAIAEFYAVHPPLMPRPDTFKLDRVAKAKARELGGGTDSPLLEEQGGAADVANHSDTLNNSDTLDGASGAGGLGGVGVSERHQHAATGPSDASVRAVPSQTGAALVLDQGLQSDRRHPPGLGEERPSGPGRGAGSASDDAPPSKEGKTASDTRGLADQAGADLGLEPSSGGEDAAETTTEMDTEAEERAAAEAAWAARDWNIQHLMFPAMRLFLKPQKFMATDGTMVQVRALLARI
jgi:hypothetical protein